jgi:hypothetical protein
MAQPPSQLCCLSSGTDTAGAAQLTLGVVSEYRGLQGQQAGKATALPSEDVT